MICPLCGFPNCLECHDSGKRLFFLCGNCALVFVPRRFHLTIGQERERYDLHDNTAANAGYVRYLNEIVETISCRYGNGASILDFGCGKNAVLAGMLRKKGFECTAYDPVYGRGPEALSGRYDCIILCEVVEHLRDIKKELETVAGILTKGGAIVIRTKLYQSIETFPAWWYIEDFTHVNFLCRKTLEYIGGTMLLGPVLASDRDIFVLQRAANCRASGPSG